MPGPKEIVVNEYGRAGVNVDVEAIASKAMYEAAKQTWQYRAGKLGEVTELDDDFSGARDSDIGGLPDGTVDHENSDGAGTIPVIARLANKWDTVGSFLMAMVTDDAAAEGYEPATMQDVLTVNTLGNDLSRIPIVEALGASLIDPCAQASVAITGGEIAQHNDQFAEQEEFDFHWDATLKSYGHRSRRIDPRSIVPGDWIVGFSDPSIGCNGISLIRRTLEERFGPSWADEIVEHQRLGDLALTPPPIYAGALVDMHGGWDLERPAKATIHGAIQLTGGGIKEKLGRLLRQTGLGAKIDNLFDPNFIFSLCQESGISDETSYQTWHMGQRLVVISPTPDLVMEVGERHGLESKVLGPVTHTTGIEVKSRGLHSYGKVLDLSSSR